MKSFLKFYFLLMKYRTFFGGGEFISYILPWLGYGLPPVIDHTDYANFEPELQVSNQCNHQSCPIILEMEENFPFSDWNSISPLF